MTNFGISSGDIRDGLLKGRIRASSRPPSRWYMAFGDALAAATMDDLLHAARRLTDKGSAPPSYREQRITRIAQRLEALRSELMRSAPAQVEDAPAQARQSALTSARNLLAKLGNVERASLAEAATVALGFATLAQAEAAREQTEQLKRVADLLSIYLADYDPNGNEARGVTTEDNGF